MKKSELIRLIVGLLFLFSSVTVDSAREDPRAAQFASDLDRIIRSLVEKEKEVLSRMRTPLDNRTPTQDLAKRLEELEVSISFKLKSCTVPVTILSLAFSQRSGLL